MIEAMSVKPRTIPMRGASTMNSRVFVQPDAMMAPQPAFATAAPA